MPRYEYTCPVCSHYYVEQRTVEEPQYFTRCNERCSYRSRRSR